MTNPRAWIAGIVLALGACGGAKGAAEPLEAARDQQPHAPSRHAAGEAAEHGDDHGDLAAPVAKFHATLAPRWHADPGAPRLADTCGALAAFHADAAAIVAAPAPDGVAADGWRTAGAELAAAVDGLDAPCQAQDAAAFEPAFAKVHAAFHHLTEQP
jgi:hypothetical protein